MNSSPTRTLTGIENKPFAEVQASLEKADRVEDLIRLYESRAREVPSVEEAAMLLTSAGQLALSRLKHIERAELLFRRALAVCPGQKESLLSLCGLYEQVSDWVSLADALEQLASGSKGADAAQWYLKAADVYEQKLNQPHRAVLCCQMAYRAFPKEREAYRRIRHIFLSERRLLPALDSIEREREAIGDRGMADDYAAVAELLVEDPSEHARVARIVDTALQIEPLNARAERVGKTLEVFDETWPDRVRHFKAASAEERDRRNAARLSLSAARILAWYEPESTQKVKETLDRCFLLWPAMPDALAFIEQRARSAGNLASAVEALEQLSKTTQESQARVDILLRIGTLKLCLDRPDLAGALAAFNMATELEPSRADAAGLAAELWVETQKAPMAVSVLERHLATRVDRQSKVNLHLRLADLCQAEAKDFDRATMHLEATLKLEPGNALAAFRLARLWVENEKLEKVFPLLESAVAAARPLGERIALCEAVAMMAEEAGAPDKAFEALSLAFQLDMGQASILEALKESAKAAGKDEALSAQLRRALQSRPDDEKLKEAASVLGQRPLAQPEKSHKEVLEEEIRQMEMTASAPDALEALYRQWLQLSPDEIHILAKLSQVLSAQAKWEEVAVAVERLVALAETPAERYEWRQRLAQLYAEKLERPEEAAQLYLNLLSDGVKDTGVIGGLERLASQGVRSRDISKALAPHYESLGDFQRQVASLLVQLSTAKDVEEQKTLLALLAETSETKLLDSRAAFDFCLRGLQLAPANLAFREKAMRLAEELGTSVELIRSLVELAKATSDAQLGESLMEDASDLAVSVSLWDDAIGALQMALQFRPDEPRFLSRLMVAYSKAGRFVECEDVLRRRIRGALPEEKAGLQLQLAEVNQRLERPREVALALQEAISAGADEIQYLPRVIENLEKAGDLKAVATSLSRMVQLAEASGDTASAQRYDERRKAVLEATMGDKTEAVHRFAAVLERSPNDTEALEALEHLLKEPSTRLHAARALSQAFDVKRAPRKRVMALQHVADTAVDALEKITALKEIASIQAHQLRQPAQALAAMAEALRLAPSDVSIRSMTRQAAEEADAVDVYAEVLTELVEEMGSDGVAVALHLELAEVFERKLNDRSTAMLHLEKVCEHNPSHLEALKSLARLQRADSMWRPLAKTLEALASGETEAVAKMAHWREAAHIYEQRLSDFEQAAACFRQIAARDALDREAASALDRLYSQLQRPRELAFALELRRNQEGQSPLGRDLSCRLAMLRRDLLEDNQGALDEFRRVLLDEPGHLKAQEALEAWVLSGGEESIQAMDLLDPIWARTGEHARRIALREARFASAVASEKERLSSEIRAIYERDLKRPEAAFLEALKEFTRGADSKQLRAELERLAESTGSLEELAEVYASTADDEIPGSEASISLFRVAAELREKLGQTEEAVSLWTKVLEAAPQDEQALDRLGQLYERSSNAKQLSEVYSQKARLTTENRERLPLLLRAGAAFEEAGDETRAIETFKAALNIAKAPQALLALERLYAKTQQGPELADILAQLAEVSVEPSAQTVYLIRQAQLLEKLQKPVEALDAYRKAMVLSPTESGAMAGLDRLLKIDVTRLEAARLLEPPVRAQNDARRLAEVLDALLTQDNLENFEALLEEAATLREAIGQKAQALVLRLRAFRHSPMNTAGRDALERLCADAGAFEELASAFEQALDKGLPAPFAEALWRRLAALYSERLARPELAASAWRKVLEFSKGDGQALDALDRLFRRLNAYRDLAEVIQTQVELSQNPQEQVEKLFELGDLADELLSDKNLAIEAYRKILEREPHNRNAMQLLGRALHDAERYAELAGLLEKEVNLAESRNADEEAFSLMVRLARLKATRLQDARGALALLGQVLSRRPSHPEAVGALEDMARSDSSLSSEAAQLLEPVFSQQGEHLKWVQMLEARAATEPSVQERAGLWRKVAEIYSATLGNAEMAFVSVTRALRELPDDTDSLSMAVKLAESADATLELADVLEELAPKAADDMARANIWRALGQLRAEMGDFSSAVKAFHSILGILPNDEEALEAIAPLLAAEGRPGELLDVRRRQLSLADSVERKEALLFEIGNLQAHVLRDSAGALATFRRLLEGNPNHAMALEAMERVCEEQQRWPELADVLSRRLSLAKDEQKLNDLRFRLGVVQETRLLNRQRALELYEEVLVRNPAHAETLAHLESIAAQGPHQFEVVKLLLQAFRSQDDSGKRIQWLETRVSHSEQSEERKTLLLEVAAIRESDNEWELAYLALYRAFKEDVSDVRVREQLESMAARTGSWDELAAAFEEALPKLELKDAASLCLTLGRVYEEKLGEPERAVPFFEKARLAGPEFEMPGLVALERLYTRLDQATELLPVVDALSEHAQSQEEKVRHYLRIGRLSFDRLKDAEGSIRAFEKVLHLAPQNSEALNELEILYDVLDLHQKLFDLLSTQVGSATLDKARMLSKMALLSAENLGDDAKAVELYRELLQVDATNLQIYAELEKILERNQRFEELAALLLEKLARISEPREFIRLNERVGQLFFRQLGRPQEAIVYFQRALERDARQRPSLEALRDIYELLDDKEEWVSALRRLVALQDTAEGVREIRVRLAELLSSMGRREEALDSARRALEVESFELSQIERLVSVFRNLKAHIDAARTLDSKASIFQQQGRLDGAVGALFELANFWRQEADKPEMAGPAYLRILDVEPSNRNAYEQALELFSQLNDWRSFAQLMERFIPNLVTDGEKLQALRELAQIREFKLGQKDVAFLALCRALQLNPADTVVQKEVERLADETGSYEELAAVYDEVAEELPKGPLAEHIYRVLAEVYDLRLDDAPAAEKALRQILEFDPTNTGALETLAQLFKKRAMFREYVVAVEQQMEAAPTIEERKAFLRDMALVYENELQSPSDAASALTRALDLEPDGETIHALVSLYRRQKDFSNVAQTLIRARDLAPTPEERARIQADVAYVLERDLGDDLAAIDGYRLALEFDPTLSAALDALDRLYTRLDRPGELLAVYERQLELSHEPHERVKLLFKSAAIWEERFRNLANADICVENVLSIEPQNVLAFKTLARLRRVQGRYEELVAVLEQQTQWVTEPIEQANLLIEMAELLHQQLKQFDKAASNYHLALDRNPRALSALHGLGTLYERSGNWPLAIDMLQREATVRGPGPESVDLHYRMGRIHEQMQLDVEAAKASYAEALSMDSGHLPSIRALREIFETQDNFDGIEQMLIQEATATPEPQPRSRAMWKVAQFFHERRENLEGAVPWYEEAIRLSPEFLEAALPLADVYLGRENWEDAERMLEVVAVQLGQKAIAEENAALANDLCRHLYRLGYVYEKREKPDKALAAYERAYQLDATYLPALEGLGRLLVSAKRLEEALKVYQTILVHHRDDLTDLEVVENYWQLGEIHTQLEQFDRAQNHYQQALGIDPGHEPSLRALVRLADQADVSDKAAEYRQRLIQVLEGDARYEVCLELGKLARVKLGDPYVAIDAYLGAHRIHAEALEVLDALYMLYRDTRQGARAADFLEKLLVLPEVQASPEKSKRVYYALGEVARDDLKDIGRALNAFNAALDLDFRFVEAFSALESLLAQSREWKLLEDNYARMIQRLMNQENTHAARMTLWRALGDLYLNVLKNEPSALMAYEAVAAGLPDDSAVQETFATLAERQGQLDAAVQAWRRALPNSRNPGKVTSSLAELAAKQKAYDRAWLASMASMHLAGEATLGDREILSKLTAYAKKKEVAQRPIGEAMWQRHLLHPAVRGPLGELLSWLFVNVGHLYQEDLSRYQINPRKHYIDVNAAPEYQIHHFRYIARLLGMEQVALFSPFLTATRERHAKRSNEPTPDAMVSIEVCHSHPISLRVGGRFFNEANPKDTYALLGKTLAWLRPELALTHRLPVQRLEAVLQAAITLCVSTYSTTVEKQWLETERRALSNALPENARAQLSRWVAAYLKTAQADDLRRYLDGVELTAWRAALFAAGEVDAVKRLFTTESFTGRVDVGQKTRELMCFSVSEDLEALRAAVGVQIEVATQRS